MKFILYLQKLIVSKKSPKATCRYMYTAHLTNIVVDIMCVNFSGT